jgi:hypothetical protein
MQRQKYEVINKEKVNRQQSTISIGKGIQIRLQGCLASSTDIRIRIMVQGQ